MEARMVASIAFNLDMEVLTDPVAPRAHRPSGAGIGGAGG
jgi:hypothetical protein